MMKIINMIEIYENDGKNAPADEILQVSSHWSDNNFVVLHYDSKSITVSAKDLQKAIENAINVSR